MNIVQQFGLLTLVQTALLQSAQTKFFCRVKNPKFSPHKMPAHVNREESGHISDFRKTYN